MPLLIAGYVIHALDKSDQDTAPASPKSSAVIPAAIDRQMDKQLPTNGETLPGVSIRNGPITEDVPMKDVNGSSSNVKRKVSRPSYAEDDSEDDDDKPIVCAEPDLPPSFIL
jgi:hypothetical protein